MSDLPQLRRVLGAYLAAGRAHSAVDARYAAAIGYCFGGAAVLEMVRGGLAVDAVVSFHGVLQSRGVSKRTEEKEVANTYSQGCKVLIENGDLDELVTPKSY